MHNLTKVTAHPCQWIMERLDGLSFVPTNAEESGTVKSTFDCIKAKQKTNANEILLNAHSCSNLYKIHQCTLFLFTLPHESLCHPCFFPDPISFLSYNLPLWIYHFTNMSEYRKTWDVNDVWCLFQMIYNKQLVTMDNWKSVAYWKVIVLLHVLCSLFYYSANNIGQFEMHLLLKHSI